ncbi:choice-of-anchor J domain-containing protein [Porphyromonas asaccharolytica]|uniref:choice-of-anchor J domain-containing protein n=1 Tax=Porphyromonas asaccharolytica TaxID=28123 RepID=UPI001FDF2728|nr:choice-of-anchor J domain-containing protein [Porphyromonas asaccharolytica]
MTSLRGGKDYDPFALPGWLNKALVGTRDFQKRSFGDVHYAQASAYKSTDPVNKCVLITPRLQMTAGSSYTVELTYSSGHTNGATLTVQQLDKDGALVKTLEVINDSTSPSGYGNQHYKKSYAIAGSAEAGYIAILYEASQEPLHTTTYQVEALTVK